jgi:hypothetical protein
LGHEIGTSVASAIWAQKSRDFRAHPFKRPEKWISPHPEIRRIEAKKKQTNWIIILGLFKNMVKIFNPA